VVLVVLASVAVVLERTQGIQIDDTPLYKRYGDAMAHGAVPYRDFRPEYPPAALPMFVAPSLVSGRDPSLDEYQRYFTILVTDLAVILIVLMAATLDALGASRVRQAAALGLAALFPVLLGPVVVARFDVWPAALTAAAVAALLAGRDRLAAAALAVGVAAKLYPAVLVPLAGVWIWRRRGRRDALLAGAVFLAVLAALALPFVVLAPDGFGAIVSRQLRRPLQIETLGAGVLIALHHLFGLGVEMRSSSGSQNVAGTLGQVVGAVQSAVELGVLAWLSVRFARGPAEPERLVRYSAAAVLAFVALGKVLSPQFLIWLVPLIPLVAGRRGLAASALFATAMVLTHVWFPFLYWDYARSFTGTVTALVLVRDLVLVAALVVLMAPPLAAPRRLARGRPDRSR
jgi:hypothetical protein